MKEPLFLTLSEVLEIHKDQIDRYGGQHGIRDRNLLESAIAQPAASFGGQWLHEDLYEMAAAYAYHISGNHPFLDGNKRTALAAALVFLELNNATLADPKERLYTAMINVASGNMDKRKLAKVLRDLPKK